MKKQLLISFLLFILPHLGLAASCDAIEPQSGELASQLHTTEATPLQYQFDSGATWNLCWHIDQHAGLVLSRVFYGAPTETPRQVLDAASIGQILFKYDEEILDSQLLSEHGLGMLATLQTDATHCVDGELLAGIDGQHICRRDHYLNPLTKTRRTETKPRHELTLHAWSRIGTHFFQQLWRLSEDGEIRPSVILSGHINRYTNDPKFGVQLDSSSLYASSATLLVNWRLDFNINSTPANDQVDEFEFRLSDSNNPPRARNILNITTESMRTVEPASFRGWRISDSALSSDGSEIENDGVGYYLDPQGAGHRYVSHNHEWTQFDFTVTNRHSCEQLTSSNSSIHPECPASLSEFTNNELLIDPVVWYSVSRHFTPRLEDYPAISATELSFALVPFDWSLQSTFSPEQEIIDDRPN